MIWGSSIMEITPGSVIFKEWVLCPSERQCLPDTPQEGLLRPLHHFGVACQLF